MRHSAKMGYNKMLPSFIHCLSTDCSSWLFHILVPCPSSSIAQGITLRMLWHPWYLLHWKCSQSPQSYPAYHSVISLLLSGSLWSHLRNKSKTKLTSAGHILENKKYGSFVCIFVVLFCLFTVYSGLYWLWIKASVTVTPHEHQGVSNQRQPLIKGQNSALLSRWVGVGCVGCHQRVRLTKGY